MRRAFAVLTVPRLSNLYRRSASRIRRQRVTLVVVRAMARETESHVLPLDCHPQRRFHRSDLTILCPAFVAKCSALS